MKLTNEILTAAIAGYEQQKRDIDERVAALRQMLHSNGTVPAAPATNGRRPMSAAARKRIAAAQRKRWATVRASEPKTAAEAARPKKRKLSAAGRKAIIEATKRRWAAFRKARAK
jgi:hypothetical protein